MRVASVGGPLCSCAPHGADAHISNIPWREEGSNRIVRDRAFLVFCLRFRSRGAARAETQAETLNALHHQVEHRKPPCVIRPHAAHLPAARGCQFTETSQSVFVRI